LASYGDAGFSLFLRKAFIKAMGYSDDALDRPIVGITNTYSDYNPCHGNVPQILEAVKRGVMLSGAMPMVFPTISIAESFSHPTSMYCRNLMAMDTEEMIRAQPMDAVVVIGGCDKTLPAQIMAAISADLPTVVIPSARWWSAITRARCWAPAPIAAGCGRSIAPARSTTTRSRRSTGGSRPRSAPAW
jgi:dihydroxy-acid dehydratase